MNKSHCYPGHNLSIDRDIVKVCPANEDADSKREVYKVALWICNGSKKRVSELLCLDHERKFINKQKQNGNNKTI